MQGTRTPPTKRDLGTWLEFRRRNGLPLPAAASPSSEATDGGGGPGSFFQAAARVLGASRHVALADGTRVSFAPPKVRTIRKVLSSPEAAQALDALGKGSGLDRARHIAALMEALMLQCLTFDGEAPKDVRAWFDDREVGEAAALVKAFAAVVKLDELVELIRPLVGAARGG